ncbi:N-acetylglucosamine-6-phosphate deacetylase [Mucilaginibacter sp.]|uniref:N-acetylglucosamine-6-phosphate deacetylase n=1 Tax=Mucilaginibacter sp. TaxID=1882438 RepID=UPI00284F1A6C|nr:N-acetylglucosamine-6-phosphate deacetylase [Mucilaginibacter sp.]MDR3695994.1 N-acetylglucosamine-6-phosphate deacetylase [Mucilaginibacter sp.]
MDQQLKIFNGKFITPSGILNNGCILITNSTITAISPENIDAPYAIEIDAGGNYVSPGFIDIHLHGGGGHDFMDNTVEAFLAIAGAHARYGTTAMLPTTLTSSKEELLETLRIYEIAHKQNINGSEFIGMHLEGPYFSIKQCGAQDPRYIRDPDPDEYTEILSNTTVIKRWSAAPELNGAIEFGKYVTSKGVLASIAHTDAIYEEILIAMENGYSLATHLYSGMSGVTRRNAFRYAGVIESAFLIDEMDVEIIADGVHLPKPLLKLVYKIKGAGKTALITDAMRAAGMPEGESILGSLKNGLKVIVEDGVAKLPDRSAFAGSVATTNKLVYNMITMAGVPLLEAVEMATATPAKIMKIENKKGTLAAGMDADIIIFDEDINIEMTIVKGRVVYRKTLADNETAGS